jgi:hypothetical protein
MKFEERARRENEKTEQEARDWGEREAKRKGKKKRHKLIFCV